LGRLEKVRKEHRSKHITNLLLRLGLQRAVYDDRFYQSNQVCEEDGVLELTVIFLFLCLKFGDAMLEGLLGSAFVSAHCLIRFLLGSLSLLIR
jgi:hypothetical protein